MRLPGKSFAPSPKEYTDVTNFVSRLRAQIGKLRPVSASRHAVPSTLRHGALRGALHAPYVGPYEVLDRSVKTYTIDIQGSSTSAAIEPNETGVRLSF